MLDQPAISSLAAKSEYPPPAPSLGLPITLPLSFLQIFGQASLIPQLFGHEQQVSMFAILSYPNSRVQG